MSPSKTTQPSYEQVIAALLRPADGPVPAAAIIDHMLTAHPSSAKNPRGAARTHLRKAVGRELVFVDADTVLPLRLAYQGARFRLPLERNIVDTGRLDIQECATGYLRHNFPVETLHLVDAAGQTIPFELKTTSATVRTPFGPTKLTSLDADLRAWFRAERVDRRDHLLFTLLDWEQGVFQMEREPARQHDPRQRAARNQLLADLFYAELETAANEMVYTHEAIPTVYAHLPDKGGYPPDHWLAVVEADERMDTDGRSLRYRGGRSSLFDFLMPDEPDKRRAAPARRLSKEQEGQVYRFRAVLTHNTGLWRTVEVQGKQKLVDLDRILRHAFSHDTGDHLSGFWKLIPRGGAAQAGAKARGGGRKGRTREEDLGDVDPLGGGSGAGVKIAELELAVGDRVKYVYDFGDWIQHELTLEAIGAPEGGVKYPREAARNEPKYANCVECQAEGRQSVAEWICLDCSDKQDKDILLCEACLAKNHEEHYCDEILY